MRQLGEMSSNLRATAYRPTAAYWGGGIGKSVCCTEGTVVR